MQTTNRLPAVLNGGTTLAESPASLERIQRVTDVMAELQAIRTFVAKELCEGTDYGKIPGTDKPTLLLPGAQKIALLYNCRADCRVRWADLPGGHLEVRVKCRLISRATGTIAAEGIGSCSTREKKYRVRSAERVCPECGKPAIIKGKKEYGGGWVCFKKKGGCGAKFGDVAPEIIDQTTGTVENPDLDDTRNTVLKMATKRAKVAAAHDLGCVADQFTQDVEDLPDFAPVDRSGTPEPEPDPAPEAPPKPAPNPIARPTTGKEFEKRLIAIEEQYPGVYDCVQEYGESLDLAVNIKDWSMPDVEAGYDIAAAFVRKAKGGAA